MVNCEYLACFNVGMLLPSHIGSVALLVEFFSLFFLTLKSITELAGTRILFFIHDMYVHNTTVQIEIVCERFVVVIVKMFESNVIFGTSKRNRKSRLPW